MIREIIVGYDYESLHNALRKMTQNNISHLPIVDPRHPEKLSGIITIRDITLSYDYYKGDTEE
jgi:CBS domain-containing protein